MKGKKYIYAIESFYDGFWSVETYEETLKDAKTQLKTYKENVTTPVRIHKIIDED